MSVYISPLKNNYLGLDRGFNQRFRLSNNLSQENGEGIYLVSNSQDVVDTLTSLNDYLPVSGEIKAISGGHCYENFVFQSAQDTNTGVRTRFVIDLSNLNGIYEERINGVDYIVIEPGASNWLIQQTLHSLYGVTLPGGSCYSVCAGGHISGGGYGLLSRLHGLTVDYLSGVEMVIPDPINTGYKIRYFAPLSDEDDLDWANRGGGAGHFGIITKYYFEKMRMPTAPESALFVTLPVPWSQFTGSEGSGSTGFSEFLRAYYRACDNLPGQAFTLGKFTCMTDEADIMSIAIQVVYGQNSGHRAAILGGVDLEPLLTKEEALEVINNFWLALEQWIFTPQELPRYKQKHYLPGHPVSAVVTFDKVYDLPWIDMTQLLNGSGENQNGKYKSSHMIENFSTEEAEEIYAFLTDTQLNNPSPSQLDKSQTLIQIDSYGLQVNAMDDESTLRTAIAARKSILKLQYQTYWKTLGDVSPSEEQEAETAIVTWFNAGYNAIHRRAQGNNIGFPVWGDKYQGCYFNYPDRQLGVNEGYTPDPGEQFGDFLQLYFDERVRDRLMEIKARIDPDNIFSFSQSVMNS